MSENITPEAVEALIAEIPGDKPLRDVWAIQDRVAATMRALAARVAELDADHAAALEAVRAQAREEAAQIADAYAQDPNCIMDRADFWAAQIAAAIRAGKVQP